METVEFPQQAVVERSGDESPFGGRRDPAYVLAAAILAFLAGCFGFMALVHDYPSDPWGHYVELAGLHGVLATFVGGLARGRWHVSLIVAWGAMVMGLLPVLDALARLSDLTISWPAWSYTIFAYGVVVPVTIAGGWFGNWLVGKIAR